MDIVTGTVTQSGGTINIRNYNSTENTGEHKFEMAAGTLNLTAGTMNINGESGNSTQYSLSVASGVTVNANSNHTIAILDNTSGTSSENRYIDMGGNNIGSLSYNVTSKIYILKEIKNYLELLLLQMAHQNRMTQLKK